VIYPPIETDYFTPDLTKQKTPEQPYFMVISRLIMYKRIDLIVKAFNQRPDLKLVIAGDGPKLDYLKKIANKNVVLLGYCSDAEVKDLMTNARATIFAAYEDFGISPVETQACGTPVIALRKGGYLETVIENETGLFFEHQTTNSLLEVIDEFLKMENNFSKETIIKQAQKFDTQVFTTKFMNFVDSKINQ
jgi:glycosyltransferase involved in cell wall biosynthesis